MIILAKILWILIFVTGLIVLFFAYSDAIDKICNDIKELKINKIIKKLLSAITIFCFGIAFLVLCVVIVKYLALIL